MFCLCPRAKTASRRTPQGVRGLKSNLIYAYCAKTRRRTPQGVRGLKYQRLNELGRKNESHPARGAWIEIFDVHAADNTRGSHPARGAWIEIPYSAKSDGSQGSSHPARGAWIEMLITPLSFDNVASHPARGAWIEIPNMPREARRERVAPRKGCVD